MLPNPPVRVLRELLGRPRFLALAVGIAVVYLPIFLFALQDLSLGGRGFEVATQSWERMWDRTGTFTFEPIARITVPGLTLLLSPLNLASGSVISGLVGLNLAVTWIALRQPRACRFNRSTGVLASLPALLAGGACCAPAIALIFGIQLSSLMIGVVQVLIPASILLLLGTLTLILARTDPQLIR